MIKKIVITGPESSGKTTLAKQIANVLDTLWVPEYARRYIEDLDRQYRKSDLLKIAKRQIKQEEIFSKNASQFLIFDTDLITIKIWSEYKYRDCDDFILKAIEKQYYDLYFLCTPDIPWTYDPQRENPNDRMELFECYKKELDFYKKTYFELKGNEEERLALAIKQIEMLG